MYDKKRSKTTDRILSQAHKNFIKSSMTKLSNNKSTLTGYIQTQNQIDNSDRNTVQKTHHTQYKMFQPDTTR